MGLGGADGAVGLLGPRLRGRPSKKQLEAERAAGIFHLSKKQRRQMQKARSATPDRNRSPGGICRRYGCEEMQRQVKELQDIVNKEEVRFLRRLRAERRTWGAAALDDLTELQGKLDEMEHQARLSKQLEARRAGMPAKIKALMRQTTALTIEARELREALEQCTLEAADWKERYLKEWEAYKQTSGEKKAYANAARKATAAVARKEVDAAAAGAKAEKEKAKLLATAAKERAKLLASAQQLSADAEAAAGESTRTIALLGEQVSHASAKAKRVQERLLEARKTMPRGPKTFSAEELDELTDEHARQVRSREIRHFKSFMTTREWDPSNLDTALFDMGLIDVLMDQKEFCNYLSIFVQELFGRCEGVHWGVNYGLWIHLEEKLPSRRVRRLRAGAAEKYDPETDRGKRKPLWVSQRFPARAHAITSPTPDTHTHAPTHAWTGEPAQRERHHLRAVHGTGALFVR